MSVSRVSVRRFSTIAAAIGVVLGGIVIDSDPAEARSRHRRSYHRQQAYSPPYAAYVVDANTGKVLHAHNENELRRPASVTKVMTLYMLFEQLEKGRLRLDSDIRISARAASMAPSKLGLRPGATLEVEEAIKALVTKSANDVAAAVGEAIGGTEERFAEMMTTKARALGMTRTHFENASGLPNPDQVTTARDLSILGRAIQDRFPRYFPYFSTHHFAFRGQVMRNHNHLLGRVEGVDGIKTGYTRASGFNLLTSAKMGNRRIVSVVLGGKTGRSRDQIMAGLVERHLETASPVRTAGLIVEPGADRFEVARPEIREIPVPRAEAARPVTAVAPVQQIRPEPVRALAFATPTAAAAALAPAPILTQAILTERPRPAVVANPVRQDDKVASIPERRPISADGSTRAATASATAAPSTTPSSLPPMRWVAGPAGQPAKAAPQIAAPAPARAAETVRVARAEPREAAHEKAEPPRSANAKGGFVIQIGAPNDAGRANELLSRAKTRNPVLAHATAFTEKVQKGAETLWRARFAGLNETQANAACKSLKSSGFDCFATRN